VRLYKPSAILFSSIISTQPPSPIMSNSSLPLGTLNKQRENTLAYFNKEVTSAYQQTNTTSNFFSRTRSILQILNLTKDEMEELEITAKKITSDANKLKNVAGEFNDLVGNLFDMVLKNWKN
jgi:hypothetical protein